jgi:DNA-binding NtrC family response regulator
MATVAVFNTSEDVVAMLRAAIEAAGFETVAGHVPDIKSGNLDFVAFMKQHDPVVVVYDIAPPYRENWTFLQTVLSTDGAKGRKFVVTTANKQLLREVTGYAVDILEISEKPDNLRQIVEAVKKSQQAS